ncbi:chemotaxis protein CheA [Roseomonas marmotae]|uniref:histidine kinase n=1 Tax=Roseomonas marmotae TaxID=2768161 RepID=A0ABS3K8P4_9PROT|nr:ATP-binding protein [Roseomonas marmotae]MBO1073295.1 Hpt domain-containing protein [Roseomonas marmotae]QTI79087.1 Hpt domain-containing protein [Roseomonas marmotae]
MSLGGDLEDELWQEFGAESEEHLDTVERLLATPPDAAGVASLFRAFHSLKGMSSALGAAGMARVAHRCEDLLGLARQGRLAMTRPLMDGLLAALDALRGQRATVLRGRGDAPPPPGLLQRLEGLEGGPPAAPPPAPPASAAPERLPELAPLAMMLRLEAAGLAGAALAMAGPSAEASALAGEAVRLGLQRLAATLKGIGTEDALPLLGRLRRQLDALAGIAGEDAGGAALSAAARGSGEAMLPPRLSALAGLLAEGGAIAPAARAAGEAAAALGHEALEVWMLLAEDLADRAPTDPEAADRLAGLAPALAAHLEHGLREGGTAWHAVPPPAGPAPAADAVPEELAHLLSTEGHRRVEAALAAGLNLYRARLGVPSHAGEEAAVQGWLEQQQAETLTSRTLLDTVPPTLDMLFLAPAEPDALAAARAAFDPAGRLLLAMSPLRTATAAPAGEGETATPASLRVRQEAVDTIITLEADLHAAVLALDGLLEQEEGDDLPELLASLSRRAGGDVARELAALSARLGHAMPPRARARSRLSLALRRLDEAVMELRVVPIGTLFARLPRIVRSVAQSSGKDVALEMEGQEVRIDRALVELLADPLLHLLRNAVDHGVEPPEARLAAGKPARATLRVRAERRTGQVRVEISDDGRGIDREAVLRAALARGLVGAGKAAEMDDAAARRLLFRPGFSTRERVSETSGRGVGLDVVQEAVRRAGGTLDLTSTPGQGTCFTLNLPLSASMAAVLLVEVAGHTYALPVARVEAVTDATEDALPLAGLLGLPPGAPGVTVLLRQATGGRLALGVDRVRQRTELLLRPLPPALAALPAVGGVGVLGNGEPVVILEPDGIAVPEE